MNPETAVVVDRFWSKVDKSGPCWLWTGALSEHGPPENRVTFRVSATKLKRFLQCPRSYFLRYVQGVEEDVKGSYLIVGNAFDQAVQHYLSQGARGVASIDPKIVRMLGAARPLLPAPGTVEVQHEYSVPHPDGFVVEGKPDLRLPGRIWDTKTCASREWALTAETLATNEQALLYAWAEFEANRELTSVTATWVYVTKATKPEAWAVTVTFHQYEVYDWFHRVVRPAVAAMRLAAAEYDADRVVANLDGCERCWVKAHCSPYDGPNSYDGLDSGVSLVQLKGRRPVSPAQQENGASNMAFDLKKLSEAGVDLVPALEASLAARADSTETSLTLKDVEAIRDAHIAINPPPVRPRKPARTPTETPTQSSLEDLASELQTVVDTCQTAIARVDRLLAALRGKGAA
jgi:hypothetical protein